jgi:hypothetical protein
VSAVPSAEPPDAVDLADAVRAVRDGLLVAEEDGRDSPLKFELGEIQMEFAVEVRREAKASGGVKAWVVNGSAEAASGGTRTQRVAFTLKPVRADTPAGAGWRIADDEAGNSWTR